jgi:hypothetical protein
LKEGVLKFNVYPDDESGRARGAGMVKMIKTQITFGRQRS